MVTLAATGPIDLMTPRALSEVADGRAATSSARLSTERTAAKVSGSSQIGQLKS
jgi:hypothetical protein